MKPLWIKNAHLLTFDAHAPLLTDHDVIIDGGRIERILPSGSATFPEAESLDARGKWLMPGLVNAHTHAYSALVRGFGKAAPALDFQQQLENLWWRLDKSLSLADCYHSTRVLALDSIRHGTTTVIDHHASPLAVRGSLRELARALDETGLRACLCYELSDRDGEKSLQEGIAENLEMIEHCRKHPSDRLTALFGMHASFTLSEATLRQVSQACQGQSIGFHIHVAEALSDQLATFKLSGRRVVKRLADWGILGPRTIAAHAVHLDADEIGLLSQSDTMVVHNPQSNQNNAVGIADVLALLRQQILVGLGTDAMTANMLEELRAALFGQHLKQNHPTCAFGEVLGLLVENNYRIVERLFGIQAGKIKPGYVGDCILFDYDPPTPLDATTWAGHLIFGLSQTPVDSTIVGGRVLMRERVLAPELNEKETLRQARQHAQAMWQRFQPK